MAPTVSRLSPRVCNFWPSGCPHSTLSPLPSTPQAQRGRRVAAHTISFPSLSGRGGDLHGPVRVREAQPLRLCSGLTWTLFQGNSGYCFSNSGMNSS